MNGKLLAMFLLVGLPFAHAEDWPTYRHDNRRSGVSAEQLPAQLSEAWTYKSRCRLRPLGRDLPNGMPFPETRTCSPCAISIPPSS